MPIATKVVSSNPVHGKVYSIQHYVIKFVSYFLWVLQFPPPIKLTHNITEILLKVALNIIKQPKSDLFVANKVKYYMRSKKIKNNDRYTWSLIKIRSCIFLKNILCWYTYNILFGVMSCNLSFIFDRPIIWKSVYGIYQSDNSSLFVLGFDS